MTKSGITPVIACNLTNRELAERQEVMQADLFRHAEEVRELDDGFAYRFAPSWASTAFDFINEERQCCRFFTFEVAFEPNNGPLWLRLRGSAEIKAFIQAQFPTRTDQGIS